MTAHDGAARFDEAAERLVSQSDISATTRETTMAAPLRPEVRALIDAANLGDTEAFLAAFTPQLGVVDDWGRKFHGPHDIRTWSDAEFIGKDVTLKVIHFYSTEDTEVTVIADVDGNGFNGPSTFTFRVADNKVAEMRITA